MRLGRGREMVAGPQRKHERHAKRQRGQYMTPASLATQVVSTLPLCKYDRILEPACGDGAFLSAVAKRLADGRHRRELVGVELDGLLARRSQAVVLDNGHEAGGTEFRICEGDFFRAYLGGLIQDTCGGSTTFAHGSFDLVIGNPPFGATFDREIEDMLDRRLGKRLGMKIKKETYAFFIVACIDLLRHGGRLTFICSDTLMTIPTMKGLRNMLMCQGDVTLTDIGLFSDETAYPVVLLDFVKRNKAGQVIRNGEVLDRGSILATPNLSWGVSKETARFFDGPLLGDSFVGTSGMTTGNNSLFVRKVQGDRVLEEPYEFQFYQARITVEHELERARLGRLPATRIAALKAAEQAGATERRVRIVRRPQPLVVSLPDSRYTPYNKANGRIVYSEPTHYIYWEGDGDAVLTFKRTGNWYLRGIGGRRFFGREGITWQLVASRFVPRFLPKGYILDSGAPCAFLDRQDDREELYFVLGWLLSDTANLILKTTINHTRNIQSKDFERMPYPWWVGRLRKNEVVERVRAMVRQARDGKVWGREDRQVRKIGRLFEWKDGERRVNGDGRGLALASDKWRKRGAVGLFSQVE